MHSGAAKPTRTLYLADLDDAEAADRMMSAGGESS